METPKSDGEKTEEFFNGTELGKMPRGKRWRESDKVPDGWLMEAAQTIEGATKYQRINLRAEAIKFENYWVSVAGKQGLKINWRRTWINWAMTAAQYAGHREREGQLSGDGYHENDDDYGIGYRP